MLNFKPPIIFLEGADKCGKTTVRRILNRQLNNSTYIIERSPASMYAYGKTFGRLVDEKYVLAVEKSFKETFDIIPIFFEVPPNILLQRFNKLDDKYKDFITLQKMHEVIKHFHEWLVYKSLWKWHVFTDYHLSPLEACRKIIRTILEGRKDG